MSGRKKRKNVPVGTVLSDVETVLQWIEDGCPEPKRFYVVNALTGLRDNLDRWKEKKLYG